MSFLKFFSGPTPEKLEKKGDALFKAGLWGQAKLEYESALVKAEKGSDLSPDWEAQLSGKIAETKEALEITSNEARTRALTKLLEKLESLQQAEVEENLANDYYGLANEHMVGQTPCPSIKFRSQAERNGLTMK